MCLDKCRLLKAKGEREILEEKLRRLSEVELDREALARHCEKLEADNAALRERLDAIYSTEPVAWLVCSVNHDGSLSLEHGAPWREAAHEHINDAINEYGIEEAAQWIVRPVINLPEKP